MNKAVEAKINSLVGTTFGASCLTLLDRYCEEVADFNSHTNLLAKADEESLAVHVHDSLSLVGLIQKLTAGIDKPKLIDIGSGGGFPGIVLAIAIENLHVTLVDSVSKKAHFLETTCERLDLESRTVVYDQRAEELIRQEKALRQSFDIATARAVGSFSLVCELTLPYLKTGGYLLAQRSMKQIEEETADRERILPILGASLEEIVQVEDDLLGRSFAIAVIAKVKPCNVKYPRQAAKLKHEPL